MSQQNISLTPKNQLMTMSEKKRMKIVNENQNTNYNFNNFGIG
jgi:hypothetical protein